MYGMFLLPHDAISSDLLLSRIRKYWRHMHDILIWRVYKLLLDCIVFTLYTSLRFVLLSWQGRKKMECPAVIQIKEIVQFIEDKYKITTNTRSAKDRASTQLRQALQAHENVTTERSFIVRHAGKISIITWVWCTPLFCPRTSVSRQKLQNSLWRCSQ